MLALVEMKITLWREDHFLILLLWEFDDNNRGWHDNDCISVRLKDNLTGGEGEGRMGLQQGLQNIGARLLGGGLLSAPWKMQFRSKVLSMFLSLLSSIKASGLKKTWISLSLSGPEEKYALLF